VLHEMTQMLRDPFLTEPFRLFNSFFGRPVAGENGRVTGWWPTLDVHETDNEYVMLVDLPGVKLEDVSIELEQQVLTVSGTRVQHSIGDTKYSERPYGSFIRTLTLPKGIDSDKIVADYQDGVLMVHVPKPAEAKPKKIAVGRSSAKAIEA
jgi:HSP20 family protein